MPWEKSYRDEDVLEKAMLAFWAHGYEATSMTDLVAATGINRGSIYSAFTDKRGLFLRALEHYDDKHRAGFLDRMATTHGPKQAIVATFRVAAQPGADRPGGCLLVNTALELSPHDPKVAAFVDTRLQEVEDFFFDRIRTAQEIGEIRSTLEARATAQALLGLFLGLRVLTRARPHPDATAAITDQVEAMLR